MTMANVKNLTYKEQSLGDAAVDGLLSGFEAGIIMAIFLGVSGLLAGEKPGAVFTHFAPDPGASPWMGLFIHLAVASVYGVFFGLVYQVFAGSLLPHIIRPKSPRSVAWVPVLVGLAYGAVLLLPARLLMFSAAGAQLNQIPYLEFALGHLLYGASLGLITYRNIQRSGS